jgi:DNA repair exonuclease SbcCD nuclease subunit
MEFIRNADCSVLMGHFEIEGFRYIPNSPQKSVGLPRSTFDRYEMVLSGHYHTKSHAGNITYLGAPYPMNWGDVDDEKYFHILDTKGWLLTPILNEDTVYAKIEYSGSKPSGVEDWSWIEGKFVRLVVTDRGDDLDQYESFVTTLQSCNPYDLKIFEDYQLTLDDSSSIMDDNSEPSVEDTRTLLGNYVRSIQTDSGISKDRLEDLILSLYTEATSDSAS